MQISLVGVRS